MSTHPIDADTLVGRRAVRRWERLSIGDLLERVTWSYPDKPAIVGLPGAYVSDARATLSYRQADRLANTVAQALLAGGLQRGDRVVLVCENSVEAYVTKFGIIKAGGVCAPINPRLAPDATAYILDHLEPRAAFIEDQFIASHGSMCQSRGLGLVVLPVADQGSGLDYTTFDDFIAGAPDDEPDAEIHADDIWQIMFTSGTTSWPKGAMMSHSMAYLAAYGHAVTHTRGLANETDLRLSSLLPLVYHAADMSDSFPAFLTGGTLVIGRGATGADFAEGVTRERVTALWSGSPRFLQEMVDAVDADPGRYDLTSLTSITWAWSSLPPETSDALRRLCGEVQLVGRLGQTESMACTRFWPDRWGELYRTTAPARNHVGVPSPMTAAALMKPTGELLDPVNDRGIPAELVYRSPALTSGYYKQAEATEDVFAHGWFHSGDSCEYDEDNLLVMVDRLKDVIKSGGENVSTIRVEAVLNRHEAVRQAAVVGLPHPRWGEAVTAFVIAQSGHVLDEAELLAYCRGLLASFETPKRIVEVPSFPVTVGDKVLKYVLRREHANLYDAADAG